MQEKMEGREPGLITSILQRSAPRKLEQPVHRLSLKALRTKSDREHARVFSEIGAKLSKSEPVSKVELRSFKASLRKLTKRGLVALITHEDE